MLPAAIVRTLTSVSCSPSTASHCISSESVRQRKGTSRAGRENKRHRKHGTPSRRKGRVRSAASLGGPDPGATRRLCPGRIARALLGFIFEEVLEDLRPGEFRWNCDASTPNSKRTPTTRAKSSPANCPTPRSPLASKPLASGSRPPPPKRTASSGSATKHARPHRGSVSARI